MREKLLGAETAAKLEQMTTPAPRMAGGRASDDDAPLHQKKKKKTAWGSSLFTWKAVTPAPVVMETVPASVQISGAGAATLLSFWHHGFARRRSINVVGGCAAVRGAGASVGTPPLRTFRAPRVTEAEALSRRDQRRRSLTAGVVDATRKTAGVILVERFTETASEEQVAAVQPKLMACSFSVDCLLSLYHRQLLNCGGRNYKRPSCEDCCPERADSQNLWAYQTRPSVPERSKPAVLAHFLGVETPGRGLLLEHASGYYRDRSTTTSTS